MPEKGSNNRENRFFNSQYLMNQEDQKNIRLQNESNNKATETNEIVGYDVKVTETVKPTEVEVTQSLNQNNTDSFSVDNNQKEVSSPIAYSDSEIKRSSPSVASEHNQNSDINSKKIESQNNNSNDTSTPSDKREDSNVNNKQSDNQNVDNNSGDLNNQVDKNNQKNSDQQGYQDTSSPDNKNTNTNNQDNNSNLGEKPKENVDTPKNEKQKESDSKDDKSDKNNSKNNQDDNKQSKNQNNNRQNNQKSNNANNNQQKDYRKNNDFKNRQKNNSGNSAKKASDGADKAKKANDAKKNAEAAKKAANTAKKAKRTSDTSKKIAHFAKYWKIYLIGGIVIIVIFFIVIIACLISSSNDSSSGSGGGSGNNSVCSAATDSPISVTRTPLTEADFIAKVEAYNSGYGSYSNLKSNAKLIYDLGQEYGINPELAVIRAEIEGYSPGSGYNYWGIGCYNGASSCTGNYNSLEDGLRAFYSTIKAYNTDSIYEVMTRYAYIGDNWYYPGSSAKGGCYYYPYVKEFLSSERSADVAESCSNGTEIKTTPEDQLAYTKYQVETNTMPLRKKIFGLESDNVSVCSKFVTTLTANLTNKDTTKIMTSADGTVSSILASNGSSVEEFNNTLLANTVEKGIGTREAVGSAAMLLINTFETYGYRIPYSYSGGWGWAYTDQNKVNHNYNVNTYYGINPNMGEAIYSNGSFGYNPGNPNNTYYYLGLDCSGFVTWSLNNGGIDYNLTQATNFKTDSNVKSYPASSTSEYVGRMGDVLSSDGHVVLVLGYNNSDQSYTVAEAGGKDLGVLIMKRYIANLSKYKVVDMSYYYENKVNSNYEEDFTNGRKG